MSVEQMFKEIQELIEFDFETENPKFQLYIAVGNAYRFINEEVKSTLYIPILDALQGPKKHTVILAFDEEFAKPGSIEYTCKKLTEFFKTSLNIQLNADFDNDYEYKTQVRQANIIASDGIDRRIDSWLNTAQISIIFLPMNLPTDYFRDIKDLTGKQSDEWTRIEHVKKYTNVSEYANTCVPKQPIYLELQKFMSKADSITIFNDAWHHINAQFYSNIYFEDMCELLYIALNSEKPIRILSKKMVPFQNTHGVNLYNDNVNYGVHDLTKDSTLFKRGGKRTKRRVYRRRVTFRKPALRR